jgi:hypothetical protein
MEGPAPSDLPKSHEQDDDDKQGTKDANAKSSVPIPICNACELTSEPADQKNNEQNDEYRTH